MRMQKRQIQEIRMSCGDWVFDPQAGPTDVLARIADHKINRLDELEALLPCF
jgi:hypothetical protein